MTRSEGTVHHTFWSPSLPLFAIANPPDWRGREGEGASSPSLFSRWALERKNGGRERKNSLTGWSRGKKEVLVFGKVAVLSGEEGRRGGHLRGPGGGIRPLLPLLSPSPPSLFPVCGRRRRGGGGLLDTPLQSSEDESTLSDLQRGEGIGDLESPKQTSSCFELWDFCLSGFLVTIPSKTWVPGYPVSSNPTRQTLVSSSSLLSGIYCLVKSNVGGSRAYTYTTAGELAVLSMQSVVAVNAPSSSSLHYQSDRQRRGGGANPQSVC